MFDESPNYPLMWNTYSATIFEPSKRMMEQPHLMQFCVDFDLFDKHIHSLPKKMDQIKYTCHKTLRVRRRPEQINGATSCKSNTSVASYLNKAVCLCVCVCERESE